MYIPEAGQPKPPESVNDIVVDETVSSSTTPPVPRCIVSGTVIPPEFVGQMMVQFPNGLAPVTVHEFCGTARVVGAAPPVGLPTERVHGVEQVYVAPPAGPVQGELIDTETFMLPPDAGVTPFMVDVAQLMSPPELWNLHTPVVNVNGELAGEIVTADAADAEAARQQTATAAKSMMRLQVLMT